ncbi:ABC transporter substrate-binding protein [Halorubellus sp. PRR65]|uniref:ABC transporter substrate-binding protein n=1 Tax=Halorubellus sp. PRR65 TaxID=3098148 RepID=UPI002B2568D4|nr:ABC transporter substrate-binding protein [Halorubellus sp. PRR65]
MTDDQGTSRRRWLQAMGIAGAAGLAGCATGPDGTETGAQTTTEGDQGFSTGTQEPTTQVGELPEVGGTYTDVISSTITTLNSMYNSEDTAGGLIANAIDPSYGFKPGQVQFPELFELTSDDDRVWTAKLRENLQWSDPYGQVTAEDYVYMIKSLHQTEWSGTTASSDWYRGGEPITVEKTGKYTFDIKLQNADPLFPKKPITWGMNVVPKDLIKPYVDEQDVQGLKENQELLDLSYTGNLGAYNLENWERQSKLTFTRNEEYYAREADDLPKLFEKAPYFERLETQIIKEPSARVGSLKTGDADSVGLEPSQAVNLEGNENINLNVAPQPYNRPIFYNMRANGWKPFRKQGVRQALGCALDKEKYVKGVQRGYANPEFTWQPQWSPWYNDDAVDKYGVGDLYGPEATRSRMEDALSGTAYSYDGDILVDGNGDQVELKLMYQSGQAIEKSTAQFIQQEFKKNAGIKVNIKSIGGLKFVTDYFRQQEPENPDELEWSAGSNNYGPRDKVTSKASWDMGLIYGLNTYPMTPTSSDVFFLKDGAFNATGYYPSYDLESLFENARTASSDEKRKEILGELFGKLSKDQPMGMLSLGTEITGYSPDLVGPEEEFFNGWNFQAWRKESGDN